jgi:hypothetical protein
MHCAFCGETRRATREHVYPDWVRQGIWATGPTTITRAKGGLRRSQATTGLTWILRHSVCRACNTGWMSRLETALRDYLLPAMRGRPIILTVETQRLVAAWAVEKALLFELKAAEEGGQVVFAPRSNLRWLYEHRDAPTAPPGSQVWIAAVDARLGTANAQPGWHTASTSLPPMDRDFYAVTFQVGYLVFQVAGQDLGEPVDDPSARQPLAILQRPDWLLPYVNAIWPARSEIVAWPRDARLKVADLRRLASWEDTVAARWTVVPIPHVG